MDKNCMTEITRRHACRHFSEAAVSPASLRCVLEAGRLAPSGFGLEPWRFLVVGQGPLHERVAEACFSQAPAVTAPALIVIAARVAALAPDSDYVRQQLGAEAGGADIGPLLAGYRSFYEGGDIAPWAVAQCQIAAAFMMLEAVHQELATCPIGGFDPAALKKAVMLPDGEIPALVLALGQCADQAGPRIRRAAGEVVSYL